MMSKRSQHNTTPIAILPKKMILSYLHLTTLRSHIRKSIKHMCKFLCRQLLGFEIPPVDGPINEIGDGSVSIGSLHHDVFGPSFEVLVVVVVGDRECRYLL